MISKIIIVAIATGIGLASYIPKGIDKAMDNPARIEEHKEYEEYAQETIDNYNQSIKKPTGTMEDLTTTQKIYVEAEKCHSLTEAEELLKKYGVEYEYHKEWRNNPAYYYVEDGDESVSIYNEGWADYTFRVLDPHPSYEGETIGHYITPDRDMFQVGFDYIDYDFYYKYRGNSRLEQMIYINDLTGLN